jgi:hypothetical protein
VSKNDLDKPIYGVEAIRREANLPNKSKTYHALSKGYLPADKLGKIWVSTPRRIRNRLNSDAPEAA